MPHHHKHHTRVVVSALPIATHLRHQGEGAMRAILERDRARAQMLLAGINPHGPKIHHDRRFREEVFNARRKKHPHSSDPTEGGGTGATPADPSPSSGDGVDVTDSGVTYTANVGVGSPATDYTLLIDTGSSNTWVGADKKYTPTSTSQSTGATVSVTYGSGSFSGKEFIDQVTISPELVIQKQSIGVASTAQDFQGVDGILGIGPVDLTQGTVSNGQEVPTVTDNLFSQGTISSNSIGISYEPTTASPSSTDSPGVMNGELTFGGTDSTKTTGEISFVPITKTSPASNYWGIDQSITYGSASGETILKSTAGIVDTGTTLLLLASDAFQAYEKATGGKLDNTTGLLTITEQQFNNLQSLFFHIGGTTFELTANAQIWPRSLNSTIGGEEGKIYLVTADMGSLSGQGLDFIDGFAFCKYSINLIELFRYMYII